MSRNRRADCCEYREEKRRLAREKIRKKAEETRDAPKKRIDECDEDVEDNYEIVQERECEENQIHRTETLSKLIPLDEEMMSRIKPSIEERDKYSMDSRHIRCFLEPAEINKLECKENMQSSLRKLPCPFDSPRPIYHDPRPWRIKSTKKKDKKKDRKKDKNKGEKEDDEKAKDVTDRPAVDNESVSGEDKPKEQMGDTKPKKKPMKSEFWCPKVKKKIDPEESSEDEIDCSDSICSFDSHIDLSGLALTEEDMKKIVETRRNGMATKVQSGGTTREGGRGV